MSLYNRLTQRDAPVAGPNPNMTPMTRKPMSLRDAVKKYAEGGNISDQYNPQEDASQNQGIDPSAIEQILRMVQAQSQPQGTTPPPKMASGTGYAIPDPYGTYTSMGNPQVGQPGVPGRTDPRPGPQVVQPQDMRYKEDPGPQPMPDDYGPTPMPVVGGDARSKYDEDQKARDAASIAKQIKSEQNYFSMAREDLGNGLYKRHMDGAIVDKDNNVLIPGKMDSGARPLPPTPTTGIPDLDAPYPLAPQYTEPGPIAATQQPYSVMPQPAYDQGYNAGYSTPSNLMSLLGAFQGPSTGGSLGAGGFGGSLGGGLTGGLPGSSTASPSNAQNSNSLDALISMLQQRNRP